jgi:hypothetical protein
MHHTYFDLNKEYILKRMNDIASFGEIETFIYAVLEEHLKNDKRKSLVSKVVSDLDTQSIFAS